jgi:hypothetical protein
MKESCSSLERGFASETDSHLDGQAVPNLSYYRNVHYRFQKNQLMVLCLYQVTLLDQPNCFLKSLQIALTN